jgi:hypothetical protein
MALPRQRSAPDPQVGKNLKTFNSFRVRLLESYAALLRELGRNGEAEAMEIRIEAINNKVSDLESVNPIQ